MIAAGVRRASEVTAESLANASDGVETGAAEAMPSTPVGRVTTLADRKAAEEHAFEERREAEAEQRRAEIAEWAKEREELVELRTQNAELAKKNANLSNKQTALFQFKVPFFFLLLKGQPYTVPSSLWTYLQLRARVFSHDTPMRRCTPAHDEIPAGRDQGPAAGKKRRVR